ncbi:MAG: murein L,D-transpeptidase catalytic domain family protein [Bacteroidales bacterium]|nr:murein L,D-transpeptidase catalytic domain family protein [Bacteroidales bacterium]
MFNFKLIFAFALVIFSIPLSKYENFTFNQEKPWPAESMLLYTEMGLDDFITYDVFRLAYQGFKKIKERKKEVLSIVDFSMPSTKKRLLVLDMESHKILFNTHVAHGKNSGWNYATAFSNKIGSYQSSLGFYLTENTYQGGNGYSLILEGLENGFNNKAKERAIVIHGADYCQPNIITASGRLGRSFGCPALPPTLSRPIIDEIKEGSVLFIYAEDSKYLAQSSFLKQ